MLNTGDNPDAPAPREMIDLEVNMNGSISKSYVHNNFQSIIFNPFNPVNLRVFVYVCVSFNKLTTLDHVECRSSTSNIKLEQLTSNCFVLGFLVGGVFFLHLRTTVY